MIQIQAPDGSIVQFPEGTDDATITRVMRENYPPPRTDIASVAGDMAGLAGRALDTGARFLARGATLGFADELAAAGNAAIGGLTGQPGTFRERFQQNVAQERARDAANDQANMLASVLMQGIGGAAAPLPIWGGAASIPSAMMRGAGTGAAYGAAAGIGNAEGTLSERLPAAVPSAAFGAGLGATVAPAMAGAGAVAGALSRAASPTARQAPAQRLMLRDLERDAVTPDELLARAIQAGDAPVALADLAGPNVLGAAQAVARMPGEGQQMARNLLQQRGGAEQAERTRQAIRDAISGEDFNASIGSVAARRRAEAEPNYRAAYETPLPADPQLERFLADPDVQRGVREGIDSARREALTNNQPFNLADYGVSIGDNGALALIPGATPTRLIDAAKRGLDVLEESARSGVGQATSQSREIANLRRALLDRVDALNPAYAQARAAYAGDTALMEAAREGRRLTSMRPEDFDVTAEDLRRMTPSEREFFRIGVARGLTDRINAAPDNAEAQRIRQLFGSPAIRERLRATFDNPEDFTRFSRVMEQEIGIATTNRAIDPRGGSPTMPLAQRERDLMNVPRGPAMASVAGTEASEFMLAPILRNLAGIGGAGLAATNTGAQLSAMAARSAAERNATDLARMLFTTEQARRVEAAQALVNRELRDRAMRGLLDPIGRRAAPGLAVGAASQSPSLPRQ